MAKELFVDNFAGGGGASTGIEMAIGRSVDIAINHDRDAIAMHKANHPTTRHYCEDVWEVEPVEACEGNPVALAWFSPDCKHFSRAKGGKPVDKNIRGLAWVAIRWAYLVRPRVIMLENVPEIQTWGPLREDGKPIKERAGETFDGFVRALTTGIQRSHPAWAEMSSALNIGENEEMAAKMERGMGYELEFREIKSCDYGAATTRTRFYLIARCDGEPIVWPEPTHAPKHSLAVKKGEKIPYRTAAECIDWSIQAQSIFGRKKPICEATMQRIANGLKKYVLEDSEPYVVEDKFVPFLIQYHGAGREEARGQSLKRPIMTLDTSNRYALIMPYIETLRNNMTGQSVKEPITTISCKDHHELVYAYLIKYYGGSRTAHDVREPIDTLTTKDRFALITVYGEKYFIEDIKMRFLAPREMYDMTGFPGDYVIDRDADGKRMTRQNQVARCGNAVTPPVPAALVRANLPEHCENTTKGETA